MSAITYTNLNTFLGNLTTDFNITSVLIEDMAEYADDMPQQIYFMSGDDMVAHWTPSSKVGVIRGIRKGSQWSTRYRKFKKLTLDQFIKTLKR